MHTHTHTHITISTKTVQNPIYFRCQTCNYTVTAKSILLLVDRLFVELDSVNVNSTDDYEDFLKKYLFISCIYVLLI